MNLSPKPPEFRPFRGLPSAEALNQILRATPRIITGDGTEIKRFGDRTVVENSDQQIIPDNELATFVVVEELEDVLLCIAYDLPVLTYSPDLPDQLLNTDFPIIYVAKPYDAQQTPFSSDATLNYIGIGERTVTPSFGQSTKQVLSPAYVAGAVITARQGTTGYYFDGLDGSRNQIVWTDISSRQWISDSVGYKVTVTAITNGVLDVFYTVRDNNNGGSWIDQDIAWAIAVGGDVVVGQEYVAIPLGKEAAGPIYMWAGYWITVTTTHTWASGTYPVGTLVTHTGSTWLATTATTAVPGYSSDWLLIVPNNRGALDADITYENGDYVQEERLLFQVQGSSETTSTIAVVRAINTISASVLTTEDSFSVVSVVRNDIADYTVTFSVAFSEFEWSGGATETMLIEVERTSNSIRLTTLDINDPDRWSISVSGSIEAPVGPVVTPNTNDVPIATTTLIVYGTGFDITSVVTLSGGATAIVVAANSESMVINITNPPASVGLLYIVVVTSGNASGVSVPIANMV